jgi:hypothetical protein
MTTSGVMAMPIDQDAGECGKVMAPPRRDFPVSRNSRHQSRWRGASSAALLIVLAALALAGCNDGDEVTGPTAGPFQLTFSLDASFRGPHGGQSVNIAVLRSSDGVMVAGGDGLVSTTQDPSFTFAAGAVLEAETDYEVHYWIDSNFGVGTPGVCDTKEIDHQWSVEFLSVSSDVAWIASHDPSLTEDVCSTFS